MNFICYPPNSSEEYKEKTLLSHQLELQFALASQTFPVKVKRGQNAKPKCQQTNTKIFTLYALKCYMNTFGYIFKRIRIRPQRERCIPTFIIASFTTHKRQKAIQIDDSINIVYAHKEIIVLKKAIWTHATTQNNPENSMLK